MINLSSGVAVVGCCPVVILSCGDVGCRLMDCVLDSDFETDHLLLVGVLCCVDRCHGHTQFLAPDAAVYLIVTLIRSFIRRH